MDQKVIEIAERLFHKKYEQLNEQEKKVADRLAERTPISRNLAKDFSEQSTFGQRLADRVTTLGGSWTFISIFGAVLFLWILLNFLLLIKLGSSFNLYPYILLNLVLSMLAAVQVPIILYEGNICHGKRIDPFDHQPHWVHRQLPAAPVRHRHIYHRLM